MRHDYRFCPQLRHRAAADSCTMEDGGAKTRLRCPACGWTHWNNPTPVLAAVIEWPTATARCCWPATPPGSGKMFGLITGFMEAGEIARGRHRARGRSKRPRCRSIALKLIGVYEFQRMNQVIIAYHALARGEIGCRPSWSSTGCSRRRTSTAGRPAPATRWPTGCARAASSRSSWSCRRRSERSKSTID